MKKSKVSIFKIILFEMRVFCMVPTYKIGSFTILEICSFRWEICLFSVTRFASSLGGDFCLHEDNISFSAKRFVCSHFFLWREIRILDWFVFCFRLRVFLRIGGLLYLKKMTNVILPKCSEFYEWGERSLPILVSWPQEIFGRFCEIFGNSILAIRCWAWSQICCERGWGPGKMDQNLEGGEIGRKKM